MRIKTLYILIFLTFLSILILSCGKSGKEINKDYLYMHLGSEPATLNPLTYTDAYSASVFEYIYEPLVKRDPDTLDFKPSLAYKWTISKNGLKYRFFLKKNIKWSDGKELTVDDVIYTFDKIMDPKVLSARLKGYYQDVRKVVKINKYTVDFYYKKRYFLAFSMLGGLTIIPKHIFNNGTDFNSHKNNRLPVGTGPYILEKWDTNKKIILKRNENYHDKKPEIKKLYFRFIPEINIALQMLKKGELDLMSVRPIQWMRQTNSKKFSKNFYKLLYYQPNYRFIAWNQLNDKFKNKNVRWAMTSMVNRIDILKKLNFGLGKIVTGNFYINGDDYNKDIKPIEYSFKNAIKFLKIAGWEDRDKDGYLDKNGEKFIFTVTLPSKSKGTERIATILKEDLSKIGIEMNINKYEWAVFLQKIDKRDFEAVILGWSLGFESDPHQVWHSSNVKNGSNFIGFKNREGDKIIDKARTELNKDKRTKAYRRFHQILHEEQPYTFLFCSPSLKVLNRRFTNVKVHKTGLDLLEWKIRKD